MSAAADRGSLSPRAATLWAALTVGAIDFAYATIFVLTKGRPWFRPWLGVASAVLGPDAMKAGVPTALFGIVLHFTVATCIVSVYMLASRWLPFLRRHWFVWGALFGFAAFVVMNFVVVPATRIGRNPFNWTGPFNVGGLLVHVLLIGPAAAIAAKRAAWRV